MTVHSLLENLSDFVLHSQKHKCLLTSSYLSYLTDCKPPFIVTTLDCMPHEMLSKN